MDEAELVYEFDFENEVQRDDFGLICTACGATTWCDDKERADYQRSITYFCYSCGARFINTGGKKNAK